MFSVSKHFLTIIKDEAIAPLLIFTIPIFPKDTPIQYKISFFL